VDINKELIFLEYVMRETEQFHAPYNPEFTFYAAVREGDTEQVAKLCGTPFTQMPGLGRLSGNPLQSWKYHFAITAALLARYCVEGGMEHETAYTLSDLYIQRADACTGEEQLSRMHSEMALDYARKMRVRRKEHIYSRHIVDCIEYIHNNLHRRIFLADLAEHTGLDPSYLSRLFKKETGLSVTEYISRKRISVAKNMLIHSDYLPSQIAAVLAFPSQSYFIEVFRKQEGITPKQYRDRYFHFGE